MDVHLAAAGKQSAEAAGQTFSSLLALLLAKHLAAQREAKSGK